MCWMFYLHNTSLTCELKVLLNSQYLKRDPHPVYLGVTLFRTLSYKQLLTKTASRVKTRVSLAKLANSSDVADARALLPSLGMFVTYQWC